ncbi:MAG: hypothetical protein WC524_02870 [Candidatus Aminicenantales bacterium]|jgi:hypothetical protein|nr:hypothetical protein [Acidobacteriota bacterium]
MEGYNTSIEYKGVKLMVQTQDKGPDFNYVESLIYLAGRVIANKRRSYTQHLDQPDLPALIKQSLEDLHTEVIDEIVEGKYDNLIT